MKVFCPECGTKHEFLDKRPKFCTDCGYSFGNNASKPAPRNVVESVPDDEPLDYNIPNIDMSELNLGNRPVFTVKDALSHPAPDLNYRRQGPGAKGLKKLQQDVRTKKENEL